MTKYKFLNYTLHRIKDSATEFEGVYQYIRKRSDCPSAAKFQKGIQLLDELMLDIIKEMKNE